MTEANHYDYAIDPNGNSTANKVLRWVGQNKRVLELGTAAGIMTRALKSQDCAVTGIEFMPDMAKLAAPACEHMIVGDINTLDFEHNLGQERFDVIIAADVLEHLLDPWSILEKLKSHIQTDGHIVISIPNVGHAGITAGLIQGRFAYQEKGLLDQTHVRFFTRQSLEEMLLRSGWIPLNWESNKVAPDECEFATEWRKLDKKTQHTLSLHPDSDVYQFIVKAAPAHDTGWQRKLYGELEQLRAELLATATELEQRKHAHQLDLASLKEHQQAFSEAKAWIAELQAELRTEKQVNAAQQLEWESLIAAHQQQAEQYEATLAEMLTQQQELSNRNIKACILAALKRP